MDAITLIVTALAAGASAGAIEALKDSAKGTAKAAYARLRGLAQRKVAGDAPAEMALTQYEVNPAAWDGALTATLKQAGAADDPELVAAAKALMEIVDQAGAKSGKYNVKVENSKGVQIGDGNLQFNKFD
jgi:hypothetical protein